MAILKSFKAVLYSGKLEYKSTLISNTYNSEFFENDFLMIEFLVHLIITPYQFGAFLMPLRPLFNQS
jgi:hypothetical protein